MTSEELKTQFKNGKYDFYGEHITTDVEIFETDLSKFSFLRFDNCTFKDISLYDIQKISTLTFHNCYFEGNLKLTRCILYELQFSFIKSLKSLSILYSCFNIIRLNSNGKPLKGIIDIDESEILEFIDCSNLYIKDGQFTLGVRYKSSNSNNYFKSAFDNSKLDLVNFSSCHFENNSSFKNLEILKTSFFIGCSFKKVSFNESNLGENAFFKDCKFESKTDFKNCKSNINSKTEFVDCTFYESSHFNNSQYFNLEFIRVNFDKKASFEAVIVNSINLYQVNFSQGAFFDDLKINNNNACDRKTLRAIKRELVNSHNQIDYLRFKAYELEAYKKEKGKSWKDSFILYFNEESNNFGLDWTKGIQFIFQWSFIFYILYIISYAARVDEKLNLPNVNDFFVNYLKFTNPLSFLNPPLENSENYFLPLVTLTLGKIFVSYGIYQTIQAFRKFGVNGG